MPPSTTTMFRAARPIFQQTSRAAFRSPFARTSGRRFQSTAAGGEGPSAQQQNGWFKRMWDSPIGFKTVHFWAPVLKWALVLAGIGDFARPVEKLSVTQNAAISATGAIWTRWCLIITPKNYLLAAVNFFLGCVGIAQLTRIAVYNASQKKLDAPVQKDAEAVQS
ncbi:putative upf0041 domain protein [Rosellinia necatrix]|uniref:Mitochondrial pyruvate carrier n=1 Tax=Rosellinia necatrix TaxID=77044 RepID=A0A1W2TAJ6_ROSNE|nr:putative upf0041 domain protein [Rosellinia necatrix]